ncbi:hypothetical protein EZH22_09865 [Xanthobacter dioxanivorans]|uniref:Uncharacterized protein n=1 Tax=Xanthobacter dioxanivorans TaxID=2528964 RepID=A0A974SLI6_9HYPH|nr:hypothetical protein [Xanthobacter dioxanivorans]QRG08558.1 hypothetical protein EZH22_09865 [Xanthobacter dioxanivorans]
MTFVSRLILVVVVSVTAAVVAVAVIAFGASDRVGEEIERARVANLLGTLKTSTEANLSIGLQLDQVSLLQPRIEREKAGDTSILAIDVFNAAGRAVFSTDRSVIGEEVSPDWVKRLTNDDVWTTVERGDTVFGTRFENDLGVAGGISVTVSDEARSARADRLGLDLATRTAALGFAGALLAAAAAGVFAYVFSRPFDRVARILRNDAVRSGDDGPLTQLADATVRSWQKAEAQVDRGLGQLGALDDAA